MTRWFLALVVALPAIVPVSFANHAGDDWHAELQALYERGDGALVHLKASWKTWSPWPIPFDPDRIQDLQASVLIVTPSGLESRPLANPELAASARHGGLVPVFDMNIVADGLEWHTAWAWELWDGCTSVFGLQHEVATLIGSEGPVFILPAVGDIMGDLEDTSGDTMLAGEALAPVVGGTGPSGPIAINGWGNAAKFGPGDDGYWECHPGNVPLG